MTYRDVPPVVFGVATVAYGVNSLLDEGSNAAVGLLLVGGVAATLASVSLSGTERGGSDVVRYCSYVTAVGTALFVVGSALTL